MKRFFIMLLVTFKIGVWQVRASAPLITIPGENINFDIQPILFIIIRTSIIFAGKIRPIRYHREHLLTTLWVRLRYFAILLTATTVFR